MNIFFAFMTLLLFACFCGIVSIYRKLAVLSQSVCLQSLTSLQSRINDSSSLIFSNHKQELTRFLNEESCELSDATRAALSHTLNELEYFAWVTNRNLLYFDDYKSLWLNPILVIIDLKVRVDTKMSGIDSSQAFEKGYPELSKLIYLFRNNQQNTTRQ